METVATRVECGGRPRELDFINHDSLPKNLNSCKENKREYFRKYMKEYYQTVEEAKEKKKQYYQKNKQHIKDRVSKNYFLNKEKKSAAI